MTRTLREEALHLAQRKLAERVRTLRKAKALSPPALAALCKIHVSQLKKIERGGANPTLQTLAIVAAGLGTAPSDLLAGISAFNASAVVPDDDPQSHQSFRRATVNSISAQSCWFDIAFTPDLLRQRMKEHLNRFVEDEFGGLRCRACNLPAIYHTLHLNVFINGSALGMTTTRSLPVCVMCHEFDGSVAQICLTTQEAIDRGLIRLPSGSGPKHVV